MANNTFFPFRAADWLVDIQIYCLTLEEEGAYIRLLAWIHHRGGTAPNNDLMISNVLRCTPRKWKKIRTTLVDYSELILLNDNGELYSRRLNEWAARKRNQTSEWVALRSQIFARDNYTCQYCGERGGELECDHIYPVALGGTDDAGNLTTACRTCNRSKGAKTLDEWQPGKVN